MQKNKLNLKKQRDVLEYLSIYDDVENIEDIVKLIRRISNLIPINQKDKVEHLMELISYIETLINGDSIAQHIAFTHRSGYAKEALEELMKYIQQHTLASFTNEKEKLESDINSLNTRKDDIQTDLQGLSQNYSDIKGKIAASKQELATIDKELEDKKQNGINIVQKEIALEREKLELENQKLVEFRKQLEKSIKMLKDELALYNNQISSGVPKDEVEWKEIDFEHPIYSQNAQSIDDYIYSLKLNYCTNVGCSMERADLAFKINCPELSSISEILRSDFYGISNANAASISRIMNYYGWGITLQNKAYILKDMLETIKLPEYQKVSSNIKTPFHQSVISDNVNVLIRELHFQKVALEALTAKNIAEQNLEKVVNLLNQFLPDNFDLIGYLNQTASESLLETSLLSKDLVKKI